MAHKLPGWLTRRADGVFEVNTGVAYPEIFKVIGVPEDNFDQYWVETAYQCAKLGVQTLVTGTELDPSPNMIQIRMVDPTHEWNLKKFKRGKGPEVATKGNEAKAHFKRIMIPWLFG